MKEYRFIPIDKANTKNKTRLGKTEGAMFIKGIIINKIPIKTDRYPASLLVLFHIISSFKVHIFRTPIIAFCLFLGI